GRRHHLRTGAAGGPGARRPARRLPSRRLLGGHGHPARQEPPRGAMGLGRGAVAALDASFWRGKRVLLTGHTGFKGSWAAIWLHGLGAEVTGLALAPDQDPALYDLAGVERLLAASLIVDLRDQAAVAAGLAGR